MYLWITKAQPTKKKDRKRFLEISEERDWKWCSHTNSRVLTESKKRRLWIPGGVPILKEILFAENLKYIFVWVSLCVERLNIKEDIPRGVFEEICSFL